jgi:putative restriction endonuclease
MDERRRWTRDELLLVLHLYERIPFGKQHQSNSDVIELAGALSRTPGSVAMKLNNFTSLDPDERTRGIKGLAGASALDRKVWNEFHTSTDAVAESEELWETRLERQPSAPSLREPPPFLGVTEATGARKIRLGQRYFRRVVFANFDQRCALTGISHPDLLTASHISPWSEDTPNRVSVENGLCLNRLHDAAFDRKLITFDDELRLVVGQRIRKALAQGALADGFLAYEGKKLAEPVRRPLSMPLVRSHRNAFLDAEK